MVRSKFKLKGTSKFEFKGIPGINDPKKVRPKTITKDNKILKAIIIKMKGKSSSPKTLRKGSKAIRTSPIRTSPIRTVTVARDIGGGRMQDFKVTIKGGRVTAKPIGKSMKQTQRFKDSGRVKKPIRTIVLKKKK